MKKALGLIETKGLVAAVAAADKALKSAKVILEGKEITEPGYVTIRFTGELNEIQIAISAGAEAARDTGELISSIVLADPDSQLSLLLETSKPFIQKDARERDVPLIPKVTKEDKPAADAAVPKKELEFFIDAPLPVLKKLSVPQKKDSGDSEKVTSFAEESKVSSPSEESKVSSPSKGSKVSSPSPLEGSKVSSPSPLEESKVSSPSPFEGEGRGEVPVRKQKIKHPANGERLAEIDTITRLRMEALGKKYNDFTPEPLMIKESTGQDLNELNVHQLRKLARSTPDFPILGRKISKANRDELLKLFNGLKN